MTHLSLAGASATATAVPQDGLWRQLALNVFRAQNAVLDAHDEQEVAEAHRVLQGLRDTAPQMREGILQTLRGLQTPAAGVSHGGLWRGLAERVSRAQQSLVVDLGDVELAEARATIDGFRALPSETRQGVRQEMQSLPA